jgi:hypothetical protein
MGYSVRHETSNLCSGTVEKGARTSGSRAALQRCLRDAPLPDPSGERPRRVSPEDSPKPRVRLANGQERHSRLQREGLDALTPGSSRPNRVHAAFDEKSAEALRQMLHCSPREFGQESSLWTLEMAADVALEEGLTTERVSGETIRATLSRLLGVRWMRAKRWITSPDPLYERKKEGATD